MEFSYLNFTSRNWAFIDKNLQEQIARTKLVFAGCGLGSCIAETAVRLGFSSIKLIDGDKVELSNLNRQIFHIDDIGSYKVDATSKILKSINPTITVETIHEFLNPENINGFINDNDQFIINTIDAGETFFEITKLAQEKDKNVLFPF